MRNDNNELERICFNCNSFFPDFPDNYTEYGICLENNLFEPYIEEIIEGKNYDSYKDLIEKNKFLGERQACEKFVESEILEMNNELVNDFRDLSKSNMLNRETIVDLLCNKQILDLDFTKAPIDRYISQLSSSDENEVKKGIRSLGAMIVLDNLQAQDTLLEYFKKLPPPKTLKEVYLKNLVLDNLNHHKTRKRLLPLLIDEIYNTPSNNTTRQYITAIFKVLQFYPKNDIKPHLLKMLENKRFSHRLKAKMKELLYVYE